MEKELSNTVMAVLIIGLTFLVTATLAFSLNSFRTSIDLTDRTSTSNFVTTSLTNTLSPVGEGITSSTVTAYNNTFLSFDGVDDYVQVTETNLTQFNGTGLANGFTISAWINPKSIGETNGRILDKSTGTAGQEGFTLNLASNNRVQFGLNNGGFKASANNASNFGVWTHILVTINSSQILNIYSNGVLSGTANQDLVQAISTINTTNAPRIGNRAGATDRTFDGSIDEVRMFNRVLTTDEITAIYNSGRIANNSLNSTGLILYVPFNEGSSTISHDISGFNNHGTLGGFQ